MESFVGNRDDGLQGRKNSMDASMRPKMISGRDFFFEVMVTNEITVTVEGFSGWTNWN